MVIQAGQSSSSLPSHSTLQGSNADESLQEGHHDLANLDLTKIHSCHSDMTAEFVADMTMLDLQAGVLTS